MSNTVREEITVTESYEYNDDGSIKSKTTTNVRTTTHDDSE